MPSLHLDCHAGISGDMFLGCLLDLGLDQGLLERELAKLNLDGYQLRVTRVVKCGISATKLDVMLNHHHHGSPQERLHEDSHDRPHDTQQEHPHHHPREHPHHHSVPHNRHDHHQRGHHRNLADIEALLAGSGLAVEVKDLARQIFRRLGEAESKIHNVPLEEIHFHEVGALDSIVDIVGAAIGVWALDITRVTCSPVHVGSGTVRCQHGVYPVPAPATAELLRSIPIYSTGVRGELATPTGAAIISSLCRDFGALPLMSATRVGYGAGTRDLADFPNVVRGFLAHDDTPKVPEVTGLASAHNTAGLAPATGPVGLALAPGLPGTAVAMEANIDDMNPEFFDHIVEKLLKTGALDVHLTPVQMKKNRPGTVIHVLAPPDRTDALAEILFRESTTIGVRMKEVHRLMLEREVKTVDTPFGPIRVKVASHAGAILNAAPEYEDCKKAAERSGSPIKVIYQAAQAQAISQLGPG